MPPGRGGGRLPADLNIVRDGFDRFDLLDDRVRFLQGTYRPSPACGADRAGRRAAHRARTRPDDVRRRARQPATPASAPAARDRRGRAGRSSNAAWRRSETAVRIGGPLVQVDWNTAAWRWRRADDAGRSVTSGEARRHRVGCRSAGPTDGRGARPQRRGRLLQHAPRGGPHAPLLVADVPAGHRRPRLRGHRASTTAPARPAPRREPRSPPSGPSSAASTIDDAAPSPITGPEPRHRRGPRRRASPLMIDGAHVLTPGVLRYGLAGHAHLRAGGRGHPAVVRRSGPAGRRQAGRLRPGRRGPPVPAHPLAHRRLPALRDRPLHRRPRLVRRHHREQLPLRPPRACSSRSAASTTASPWPAAATPTSSCTSGSHAHPGINPASVLGEGTFHQFHGGTTTNVADEAERRDRVFSYGEHFRATRGRGLNGLQQAGPLRRGHGHQGRPAHPVARARSCSPSTATGTRWPPPTPHPCRCPRS